MKIGFVGLGKMGGSMVKRLLRHDHEIIGYDSNEKSLEHIPRCQENLQEYLLLLKQLLQNIKLSFYFLSF